MAVVGSTFVRILSRAVAWLGAFAAGAAIAAPEPAVFGPNLIEEHVRIPARDGAYLLAATILRPEGPGPFGAVVLNHGVPVSERERLRASADAFDSAAPVFARRGYVVVMPLRRGFGETGGEFAEDAGSCRNPDYDRAEREAAEDVMAAYEYAQSLPYVDGNRMILAGQSAGGFVSIFTAGTRAPRGLRAVLSFAGGRGGNPERRPGVPCAVEPVAKLFDALGKHVRVPVLFHYAENDLFFNPDTSRHWYQRFVAGGAPAEYVLQPRFGRDGHYMFGELTGVRYWLPAVERFFVKHALPFERLDAADPTAQPLLAVQKLPHVRDNSCRDIYRAFLETPAPRAYAVSGDGHCGFAWGHADAGERALAQCTQLSATGECELYAVDNQVVWGPAEANRAVASSAPRMPAAQSSTGGGK